MRAVPLIGRLSMILKACPRCDRQYDVSHLVAGCRVRCACDAVFDVKSTSPLQVTALVCRHCGGPIGANDEACGYCAAKLDQDERHSTLCPQCFARMDDSARHCSSCGLAIEPQALTPIPEGRQCPRCEGPLRIRCIGQRTAIECSICQGLWVERAVFESISREALTPWSPPPTLPAFTLRVHPLSGPVHYIPCLACGELMLRSQYRCAGRASGVIIDACRQHGVWLDHAELERVLSFLRAGSSGLEEIGQVALTQRPSGGRSERRLPTVVPPPPRQNPLTEALRFLGGVLGDFFE